MVFNSNTVDAHWQKPSVTSHIQRNVLATVLLNIKEIKNITLSMII